MVEGGDGAGEIKMRRVGCVGKLVAFFSRWNADYMWILLKTVFVTTTRRRSHSCDVSGSGSCHGVRILPN